MGAALLLLLLLLAASRMFGRRMASLSGRCINIGDGARPSSATGSDMTHDGDTSAGEFRLLRLLLLLAVAAAASGLPHWSSLPPAALLRAVRSTTARERERTVVH